MSPFLTNRWAASMKWWMGSHRELECEIGMVVEGTWCCSYKMHRVFPLRDAGERECCVKWWRQGWTAGESGFIWTAEGSSGQGFQAHKNELPLHLSSFFWIFSSKWDRSEARENVQVIPTSVESQTEFEESWSLFFSCQLMPKSLTPRKRVRFRLENQLLTEMTWPHFFSKYLITQSQSTYRLHTVSLQPLKSFFFLIF